MTRVRPVLAAYAFAAVGAVAAPAALADIPPPPYHGSSTVTVAGLEFDRADGHLPYDPHPHPGPPRRTFKASRLKGCAGPSHNCDAVTKAGVIGWAVSKVDGKFVAYGELDALRMQLGDHSPPAKVTFERIDGVERGTREVTLARYR
jgi:hypothetical protein